MKDSIAKAYYFTCMIVFAVIAAVFFIGILCSLALLIIALWNGRWLAAFVFGLVFIACPFFGSIFADLSHSNYMCFCLKNLMHWLQSK